MRTLLFGILGFYGEDPAVIAQAGELTQKFYANPTSVDPTLARTAIYITVRHGDANLYEMLQKSYETSTVPEMQEGSLRMMAMFNDPVLLKRALDYALTDKVRNQDSLIQFYIAMQRDETRAFTWKYIQDHWEQIKNEVTPEMGGLLVGAFGGFCTADERDNVESFFKDHAIASADRALKHTVESINSCIEFRAQQEPNLKAWIAAQK